MVIEIVQKLLQVAMFGFAFIFSLALSGEEFGIFGAIITTKVYEEQIKDKKNSEEERGRKRPVGEALLRGTLIVTFLAVVGVSAQVFSKISSLVWTGLGSFLFPSEDGLTIRAAQHEKFMTFLNSYFIFWPTKSLQILGAAFLTGYQCWEYRVTCH